MGLINMLLGNASEIDVESLQKEFGEIMCEGETIESAYAVIRDKWVFTNKRLIILNVQGVTGSKREYRSLPYGSIVQFSVETAGTLEDDSELKIWVKGSTTPFKQEFSRKTNVKGIQKSLAQHII